MLCFCFSPRSEMRTEQGFLWNKIGTEVSIALYRGEAAWLLDCLLDCSFIPSKNCAEELKGKRRGLKGTLLELAGFLGANSKVPSRWSQRKNPIEMFEPAQHEWRKLSVSTWSNWRKSFITITYRYSPTRWFTQPKNNWKIIYIWILRIAMEKSSSLFDSASAFAVFQPLSGSLCLLSCPLLAGSFVNSSTELPLYRTRKMPRKSNK